MSLPETSRAKLNLSSRFDRLQEVAGRPWPQVQNKPQAEFSGFEVLNDELLSPSYFSCVNVKIAFFFQSQPFDWSASCLSIIALPSHKHNSLKECGEFPVSSWGIWFVFPVAGSQFIIFFSLALFNFLSRCLALQTGCGGECQKPLIRLLLSFHPDPPTHCKKLQDHIHFMCVKDNGRAFRWELK